MPARHPLPRAWLMTDERIGEGLWPALRRVPEEGGIVFRHYATPAAERRRLFDQVRKAAGERLLLLAGLAEDALAWGADGSHGRSAGYGLRTAPVHNLGELHAAEATGAALVFLSPVFPTRSHPDARTLGPAGFEAIAAASKLPVVALGGMDAERWRQLPSAYGWAGINAWLA